MKLDELATPLVFISEKILKSNIRRMRDHCRKHKINLRPHVKSHNIPEIAHWQIKEGNIGITTANLREANVMAENGIKDIFIAREITDWMELKQLIKLMKNASISLAVDSTEGIHRLSKVMEVNGLKIEVLVEVDVGGRRCGIASTSGIAELAMEIQNTKGLIFKGLFTHEGNVYSAGDHEQMNKIAGDTAKKMMKISRFLNDKGIDTSVVSIGSSPSVKLIDDFQGITEIRPGNYVFNDAMQIANRSANLNECALKVIATVISKPIEERVVLNVGTKLLGSDMGSNVSSVGGYGILINPEKHIISRIYEEHSIIEGKNSLKIGQRVTFIPSHACMAANLAKEIFLVDEKNCVIEFQRTGGKNV